jgi:hypothetical protein
MYRPLTEIRAFTGLNTLFFGGLAGLTEAGAILIKARGVITARRFAKMVADSISNRKEMMAFAESMGTIHSQMQASLNSQLMANADSFDGIFSKHIPKFLEWTGNEAMARHMRGLSTLTAREYIVELARRLQAGETRGGDYERYLRELDPTLTPEEILAWDARGGGSWATIPRDQEHRAEWQVAVKMNHAIARYVQETVINPMAADTPPSAKNPWWALVWHLKGFNMTMQKRLLPGIYRELQHQVDKGGMTQAAANAAAWVLPGVMFLLLLSAIQEELRQRLRSLGEKGIVGNYNGDIGDITKALTDRAGLTSIPFIGAFTDPSVSNVAFALGPTASKTLQLATDLSEGDVTGAVLHQVPVVSQLPGLRKEVYDRLENAGVRE